MRLLYAELLAALKLQVDEIDTVERKATFLLAPIAAALGLGVNAIGKLGPSMWAQGTFNSGLMLLVVALFASVGAMWFTDVWSVPGGEGIWPDYATADPLTYLIDACATVAEMWERNRDLQRARSKETWVKGQVALLTVGGDHDDDRLRTQSNGWYTLSPRHGYTEPLASAPTLGNAAAAARSEVVASAAQPKADGERQEL